MLFHKPLRLEMRILNNLTPLQRENNQTRTRSKNLIHHTHSVCLSVSRLTGARRPADSSSDRAASVTAARKETGGKRYID